MYSKHKKNVSKRLIIYKAVKTYTFFTHSSFYVFILGAVKNETFSKYVASFQKVKVLKYYGYKCPSFSKLCGIPSAHAYELYLKL